MNADFKDVCWLLDHDFKFSCIDDKQYYFIPFSRKSIYVRKLDPTEPKTFYKDNYVCFLNKSTGSGELVVSSAINFNSSKDWIKATGTSPKDAILNALTKAYADRDVKHKEELRSFEFTLNPIVCFIRDCIRYFTNRY